MNYLEKFINFKQQLFTLMSERRCLYCNIPFISNSNQQQPYLNDIVIIYQNNSTAVNHEILNNFSNFIQSNLCPSCASDFRIKTDKFCQLCGAKINLETASFNICGVCSAQKPPWENFYHINNYNTMLKAFIIRAKFNRSNVALKFLGSLLAHFWLIHYHIAKQKDSSVPDILIPIPLHQKRLHERGFNQCAEMAKFFLAELQKQTTLCPSIIMDTASLTRLKYKPPQSMLNYKARLKNTKNTFNADKIDSKHILLLDDVSTTNSTLKEACHCLKNAGAQKIDVLVIAKA